VSLEGLENELKRIQEEVEERRDRLEGLEAVRARE